MEVVMGLITEWVEVGMSGNSIEHYENLGYKIPRMKNKLGKSVCVKGARIFVKVEDLTKGSGVIVTYKCEACYRSFDVPYAQYLEYKRQDEKTYCRDCSHTNNFYSIGQWMIDNKIDINLYWGKQNIKSPFEYTYRSEKEVYFNCVSTDYHGEFLSKICIFTSSKEKCIFCSGAKVHIKDSLGYLYPGVLEHWSDKNETSPLEYLPHSNKKVYFKCLKNKNHPDRYVFVKNFIEKKDCCYCTKQRLGSIEESFGYLYPEYLKLWSDKNNISAYEVFSHSNKEYWFKCKDDIHEDYSRSLCASFKYEFKCADCSAERIESNIQQKVRNYLENLGYIINHEKNCLLKPINPKTKRLLLYDNEIIELKLIIETMGGQHSDGGRFFKTKFRMSENESIIKYDELLERDAYKKQYALGHNYYYLEISYKDIEKNDNYKKVIDDKIKEIKGEI